MTARIRQLTIEDAAELFELRRESLADTPLAFGSSLEDDLAATVEATRELLERKPQTIVFGAFDPHLVGSAGLYRSTKVKARHKLHVWGVYVTPAHRRRGLARQLLRAIVAYARTAPGVDWLQLGVSASTPGAQRLYERAGFVRWGTEPEALDHEGRRADEHFMALRLRGSSERG